ncbi:hypothetical protein Pcinc_002872 [Petrolisthes cinctipes]|uniref:Reverse transcriptase domain-containing protein n=1 Tax=Petrolisthes cinctipes TaxID=88211 RepID=A0AAE1L318_PETCI|nr:hypothetical protein Pcinc_002872 [Petrolisthes cinctipes]
MMFYIVQCFPEPLGYKEKAHRPAPLGEVRQVEDKLIRLTGVQPMDFTLEAATKALLYATEGSRPSLARYPPTNTGRSMHIQLALVDTARDSAFALTNVKAMRREAILSQLQPVFKSATKVDLRKSAIIDSAVLFDEDRVKEALRVADKTASISFKQAAAWALVKPRPAKGTLLVERGSHSNTADRLLTQQPGSWTGGLLLERRLGFSPSSTKATRFRSVLVHQSPSKQSGFGPTPWHRKWAKALDSEVQLLLAKGAIEEAPTTPGFYSHLFVVTKATGGFRPVLDLSSLNRYVTTTQFRMETVRTVLSVICSHEWMTAIDLKDAYFQILIHPDSLKFLRFI